MKTYATIVGIRGCGKAQKCAHFERKSTRTMMTDLLPSFGRPTIKSIEMLVKIEYGMGSG
jgi:hypothetical protein